jgi:uncharacterized membrane protein YcaP (DUF421 family)
MEENEIHILDIQRIIIGEANFDFYIEIIFRIVFICLLLMTSMRLLGQRMASQLSRIEMAAMVSLAAAVGVPLQTPERGLLPGLVIAIVVVLITRTISSYASKNEKFESVSQGDMSILIKDGRLLHENMIKSRISRERMFAQLRSEEIIHLGEVQRVYFEANGSFSIIKFDKPIPGVSIIPEWDNEFVKELPRSEKKVCRNCGNLSGKQKDIADSCEVCDSLDWINAVSS